MNKDISQWKKKFPDTCHLFRGLPKEFIVWEEMRVSSGAFRDPEASCDRDDMATSSDTLESNKIFMGVAKLNRVVPIEKNLDVVHSPTLINKAHCLIKGKKSTSLRRHLAKNSKIDLLSDDAQNYM